MDLNNLADFCEKITGPDRELDTAIATALGRDDRVFEGANKRLDRGTGIWTVEDAHMSEPVTESLEAATGLFPPDTMYRSGHSALAPDPTMFFCDAVTEDGRDHHSLAMTEAGARAAAALRARAHLAQTGEE